MHPVVYIDLGVFLPLHNTLILWLDTSISQFIIADTTDFSNGWLSSGVYIFSYKYMYIAEYKIKTDPLLVA
jgi:hypothetical protein